MYLLRELDEMLSAHPNMLWLISLEALVSVLKTITF